MKKLIATLTIFVLSCFFASTAFAKKITVACDTNFPPFEFKDPKIKASNAYAMIFPHARSCTDSQLLQVIHFDFLQLSFVLK